jgi:hypothetical protein
VRGEKDVTDYIALFDHDVDVLVRTIGETGAK